MTKKNSNRPEIDQPEIDQPVVLVPRTMEQIVRDEMDDLWLIALQFIKQHSWEPSAAVNGIIQARVEILKAAGLLLDDGAETKSCPELEDETVG